MCWRLTGERERTGGSRAVCRRAPRRADRGERESTCRFKRRSCPRRSGSELPSCGRNIADAPRRRLPARQRCTLRTFISASVCRRSARTFGRDRTTVAHACACVEDSRDDPKFERVLACLEAALDRWHQSFIALRSRRRCASDRAERRPRRFFVLLVLSPPRASSRQAMAGFRLVATAGARMRLSGATVRRLRARGLLVEGRSPESSSPAPRRRARLKRQSGADRAVSHAARRGGRDRHDAATTPQVLVDLDESPIAALARRREEMASRGSPPILRLRPSGCGATSRSASCSRASPRTGRRASTTAAGPATAQA